MKQLSFFNSVVLLTTFLLSAQPLWAGGAVENSYRKARSVIDSSLEVMQSSDWERNNTPITIKAEGTMYPGAENQGRNPDDETPTSFREIWSLDPLSGQLSIEFNHHRLDGESEWIRELYLNRSEQLLGIMDSRFSIRFKGDRFNKDRDRQLRRMPTLLLKEALESPRALRWLGRFGPYEGVQILTRDGESLSLFFGKESHVLSQVEYLINLPTIGDSTISWKFSDYQEVPGLGMIPYRYVVYINKQPFLDMNVVDVVTDPAQVRSYLNLPQDVEQPVVRSVEDDWDPSSRAKVETITTGVHIVKNLRQGFHMMFVEFKDFILAIDAPSGYPLLTGLPAGEVAPGPSESWLSDRFISIIKEIVPDKPIRLNVLTHFHNDHAGGLVSFLNEGASLIVHESIEDAVETFLENPQTLCMDHVDHPDGHRIETISDRKIISDGTRTVEILDVPDNPHTDHMLVVWLPQEKILYVADLITDINADPPTPLNTFFANWLKNSGLEPETIFSTHSSEPIDIAKLMSLAD